MMEPVDPLERALAKKFADDYIKIEDNVKCRYFNLVLSSSLTKRHHDLVVEFIERGIKNPSFSYSGPWEENEKYNHLQFFMDERVADEYLRRMQE